MTESPEDEMTPGDVAREIKRSRQWAWELLSNGRIANARQILGRWWVAPRRDVLIYKNLMEKGGRKAA